MWWLGKYKLAIPILNFEAAPKMYMSAISCKFRIFMDILIKSEKNGRFKKYGFASK